MTLKKKLELANHNAMALAHQQMETCLFYLKFCQHQTDEGIHELVDNLLAGIHGCPTCEAEESVGHKHATLQ